MAKTKDPAFLFYPSDFIIGTMRMTYEQKGKYIQLLCMQHDLYELTQSDIDFVLNEKDQIVLSKFSRTENGNYYNQRLRLESDKRKQYSESRRNNRVKNSPSSDVNLVNKDMNNICESYDEHMVNRDRVINTNDINLLKEGVQGKKTFVIPTLDELNMYKFETNSNVDVNEFFDHYNSNGWQIGKNEMKDWKSTFRGWTKRRRNDPDIKKDSQNQASHTDTPESIKRAEEIGIIMI